MATTILMFRSDSGAAARIGRMDAVLQNVRGDPIPVTVEWGRMEVGSNTPASTAVDTLPVDLPLRGVLPLKVTVATYHGSTPHRGFLLIEFQDASGHKPFVREREMRITGGGGPPAHAHAILRRSLIIALGLVGIALLLALISRNWAESPAPAGGPSVEFTSSWASNLAIGATLLTALIPLAVFPDQPRHLTKSTYVILGAVFSFFVATSVLLGGILTAMRLEKGWRRLFVWLSVCSLAARLVGCIRTVVHAARADGRTRGLTCPAALYGGLAHLHAHGRRPAPRLSRDLQCCVETAQRFFG